MPSDIIWENNYTADIYINYSILMIARWSCLVIACICFGFSQQIISRTRYWRPHLLSVRRTITVYTVPPDIIETSLAKWLTVRRLSIKIALWISRITRYGILRAWAEWALFLYSIANIVLSNYQCNGITDLHESFTNLYFLVLMHRSYHFAW